MSAPDRIARVEAAPDDQRVANADGLGILPTITGDPEPSRTGYATWAFLDADSFDGAAGQAARRGDRKAVREPVTVPVELYNPRGGPGGST